jgi:hypothetical protein
MAKRGMPTMMAQMFSEEDDVPLSFPMQDAQRDMLRQAVDLSNREAASFKKGDAVHYLGGFGPMKREAKAGLVFVFWGYLDPENIADLRRIEEATPVEVSTLPDIDCLIAYFAGQEVRFDIACSGLLVPGDTAEAA